MATVLIHPGVDAFYYAFYLLGLQEFMPGVSWRYTKKSFPRDVSPECLSLTIRSGGREHRMVIDATDGPDIRQSELEWCHRYGKVNLQPSSMEGPLADRLMPLGPNFGIRLWGPLKSAAVCAQTLLAGGGRDGWLKEHVANFMRQCRYRVGESSYRHARRAQPDYVFHLSSLWSADPAVNNNRAIFIAACRAQPGLSFEGGFAPFRHGLEAEGFQDMLASRRYSMSEWLDATERSCLVFNTPAVLDCHGWKLGEYLALGKAIISTPLTRELPAPLQHGTHLHLVEPEPRQIADAIARIRQDQEYRMRLEAHARQYYEEHLAPAAVMRKLFA